MVKPSTVLICIYLCVQSFLKKKKEKKKNIKFFLLETTNMCTVVDDSTWLTLKVMLSFESLNLACPCKTGARTLLLNWLGMSVLVFLHTPVMPFL